MRAGEGERPAEGEELEGIDRAPPVCRPGNERAPGWLGCRVGGLGLVCAAGGGSASQMVRETWLRDGERDQKGCGSTLTVQAVRV